MSYEIIYFLKIIGSHKEPANYIKELSNGIIISGGENNLFFYNNFGKKIANYEIENINIYEKESDGNITHLLVCSNEESNTLLFNQNDSSIKYNNEKSEKNMRVYFKTKNNYLICNEKGIFLLNEINKKITIQKENKIKKNSFWSGIKIDDNLFAFTSNKVLLNGEDKIIIYDSTSKHIKKEIKNYSSVLNQNNLSLIHIEEIKNTKILLCACKKYIKSQKNGILLIKLLFDKKIPNLDIKIKEIFYETGDFEVYCFCQIFKVENKNKKRIFLKNNNKINKTKYFLVGGFDPIKNQGLIKLYRINYNNKNLNIIEIEYIQNIEIKKENKRDKDFQSKFKGFKGPITCIEQSKFSEKILITCFDGNVYLFSPPNIEKYINKENINL